MKKITLLLLLGVFMLKGLALHAQEGNPAQLDNYKYVIVPMQFDFQKEENQYLINSHLRQLLKQEGFEVYMDTEEFPDELSLNPCLALRATVKSLSEGMFSMNTQMEVIFKDCRNREVYKTRVGMSRIKDYAKGYYAALNDAFKSFDNIHYHYNGEKNPVSGEVATRQSSQKDDTANLSGQLKSTPSNPFSQVIGKTYVRDGENYKVTKIQAGYLLQNKDSGKRVAVMNMTGDHTILYNSDKINGTAKIAAKGNSIRVEYFDKSTQKIAKMVFYRAQE